MEAEITEAAEKYAATAGPINDPLSALLGLAGEIAAFKDFIGRKVTELQAEKWRYRGEHAEQLRAEIGLYERALDRTAKVLVDISRLGLEERMVTLSERQGALIADAIREILAALDLTDEQQARVPEIVPRVLRSVSERDAS